MRRNVNRIETDYSNVDPRKEKRYFREHQPECYMAYITGESDGMTGKKRPNLFAPGRRRDEYNRGFDNADPMGDWHGRNY